MSQSSDPPTSGSPWEVTRAELAASRMAILRAADIAADHAKLIGSAGMQAESARFLHQAARIADVLRTGRAPEFRMPEEARHAE